MLTYVVGHLSTHVLLLVSLSLADAVDRVVIAPWRSVPGTVLLAGALLVHYGNALWSIYVRRTLRLSRWGWWQLALGLSIPLLLSLHVSSTRLSEEAFGSLSEYENVLLRQWLLSPWKGVAQALMLSVVWTHAAIGIHFWLRTKPWYGRWQRPLAIAALLLPALALAGYVAGGNEVLRAAREAGFAEAELAKSHIGPDVSRWADRAAAAIVVAHLLLVGGAFAARALRQQFERRSHRVVLRHPGGRSVPVARGATVLETLNEHRIAHASVCGGRARCTTCRVRVLDGLDALPPPAPLEARALERIGAPSDCRLACQLRPTADLTIVPLLPPAARPQDGHTAAGFAGHEQLVTVMFVDLRGSTRLGEARLPYDVLFLLDQVFRELREALAAAGGHFSQFTGDGLMALFGHEGGDPGEAARAALATGRDILERVERLNRHLLSELPHPLKVGVGIHHGLAIVGPIGPPRSQILTAIGDTVNITARLEGLSKQHDGAVIVSRSMAEAAGLELARTAPLVATLSGRTEPVEYYALPSPPTPLPQAGEGGTRATSAGG